MITKQFSLDNISLLVKHELVPFLQAYRIFTFTGPLGAGKTTLIKEILRQCGVKDIVVSPTFTYVQRYVNDKKQAFYHFDLYRLQSVNSFFELGFDEYLGDSKNTIFIEWPEIIEEFLADPSIKDMVCKISLEYLKDDISSRFLRIQ